METSERDRVIRGKGNSWDEILFRANKVDIENYSVNSLPATPSVPFRLLSLFSSSSWIGRMVLKGWIIPFPPLFLV